MIALRFRPGPLASPLPGVADEKWTKLVRALDVQDSRAISKQGHFGSYALPPRRLVELGLGWNLRSHRADQANGSGSMIHECDFKLPLSQKRLLSDPIAQLSILSRSLSRYHAQLTSGEIARPASCSVAGALAILHRGGLGALRGWPKLFPKTQILYVLARGAF